MQGWEDRSAGSVRVLNCPESHVQQGSPRSLGTRWPMLLTRSPSTSSASSRYVVSPSYSAYGCIYKCKNLCAHKSAFFHHQICITIPSLHDIWEHVSHSIYWKVYDPTNENVVYLARNYVCKRHWNIYHMYKVWKFLSFIGHQVPWTMLLFIGLTIIKIGLEVNKKQEVVALVNQCMGKLITV